jgi:hypothetical protein
LIFGQSYREPAFALIALALLAGCKRPMRDQSTLRAIKAEAKMLMEQPTDKANAAVKRHLSPAMANLKPEFVQVKQEGVYITTTAYFDGGWGYFVPRDEQVTPEPASCFTKIGQSIYWYEPC